MEFDWDEHNEAHVRDHLVEPHEAEEALADPRRRKGPAYNVAGEKRQSIFGSTEIGRILFVVFTHRNGAIRVVTAREPGKHVKRRYRRER